MLALFVSFTKQTTFTGGLGIGMLAWLGFSATGAMAGVLWEKKPFKLFAINELFRLIGFAVIGGILAIW